MEKFTVLTGVAAPLPIVNVDTDMIIPKQHLKTIKRTGLGTALFEEMRYDVSGKENPDFVLNKPAYRKAQILVAGENFGCGSSREHAVWALHEFGIRAVIAPSFAPIFFGNCVRNGIVPVRLAEAAVAELAGYAAGDPQANTITVDLEAREVRAGTTQRFAFDIDAESRDMLLEGLDAIDLTLKNRREIAAFVERDRVARPWIYSGAAVE